MNTKKSPFNFQISGHVPNRVSKKQTSSVTQRRYCLGLHSICQKCASFHKDYLLVIKTIVAPNVDKAIEQVNKQQKLVKHNKKKSTLVVNCNEVAIALWQKDSLCVISLIATENPENMQSELAFQIAQALMLSHYCLI